MGNLDISGVVKAWEVAKFLMIITLFSDNVSREADIECHGLLSILQSFIIYRQSSDISYTWVK